MFYAPPHPPPPKKKKKRKKILQHYKDRFPRWLVWRCLSVNMFPCYLYFPLFPL